MRVFVDRLAIGEVAIAGDEHHYLGRVRRARIGDALELVDGAGMRARATIARMTATETIAIIEAGAIELDPPPQPHVRALVPLIKGDRMDSCLEKLVEVGASEIVAWPAERSVVRLEPSKRATRVQHYAGVLTAAARQSGARAPAIVYAESLASAVVTLPAGRRFVLVPTAEPAALGGDTDVTIASGPEGGLAPAELDLLVGAGFAPLGLGPRVLRAETAPVVAVALVRAASRS